MENKEILQCVYKIQVLQQKFPEEDSENKNNNALILLYNPIFSNYPLFLKKHEL